MARSKLWAAGAYDDSPGQGERMYWEYFGFEENPFSISPDPRYLYMSKRHQEALAHLVYGIGEAGGFVLLSGEVGTGKTTICRSLIEQLPDTVDLAFVLNPRLNEIELLATICDEMGVAYPRENPSLKVLVDRLNDHLLNAHGRGRQPVLIIDEAQNLSPDVLEQIRLLTNLETTKRKLLQMVLIGQPELKEMLKRPGLRQLDQRITARYHLTPLGLQEAGAYIRHRLQVAGTTDAIFNDAAIRTIYRLSGGVPRLINTLCDRCLLGAYAENKRTVDARLVHSAATEVLGLRPRRRGGLIVASGCFAAVAAAGFVLIDPLDQNLLQYIPLPVPIELVTETSGERSADHESSSSEASSAAAEDTGIVPATVAQISPTRSQADPPDRQTNLAVYATDLSPTPEPAVGLAPATVPPPGPPPRFKAHAPTSEAPAILSGMFEGEPIAVLDNAAATVPPTAPPTAPLTVAADLGATVNGGRIGNGGGLAPHTPEPEASDRVQLVWGGPGLVGDPANEAPTNPLAEPMIVALPTIPPPPRPPESAQDLFALAEPFGDIESAASSLFQVWDCTFATLKGVTPCGKARYAKLRCLQSQATWHELRIANRPVVITLSDGEDRRIYATVVGLDGDEADIFVDGYSLQSSVGWCRKVGGKLENWRKLLIVKHSERRCAAAERSLRHETSYGIDVAQSIFR